MALSMNILLIAASLSLSLSLASGTLVDADDTTSLLQIKVIKVADLDSQSDQEVISKAGAYDELKAGREGPTAHMDMWRLMMKEVLKIRNLTGAVDPSGEDCPLPSNARKCLVTAAAALNGAAPFLMAVYGSHDGVSDAICKDGRWEDTNVEKLGTPGHALDIGGNIGYFSFILANAGWTVTTFEPIAKNVELMQATLCMNPHMRSKVTIHNVGLGAHADECNIISGIDNAGDGWVRCGADKLNPIPNGFQLRQSFHVQRLDDLLSTKAVPKVDFVKIDVEGFECQVFKGGSKVLEYYRPRKILTEVWQKMQECKPGDYLKMFAFNGYGIYADDACSKRDNVAPSAPGEIKNFWLCRDSASG